MTSDGPVTYEAYCPTCGEERRVLRTVPWQDDACEACGGSVESE